MARRRKIPTPSWEHQQPGTLGRRLDASAWKLWATAGVILLVIASLGVVGWGFLSDYIEDQNRPGSTAIKVEDREYSVRDFTRRAQLYVSQNGGQNNAFIVVPTVSADLIEEALLLKFAAEKNVEATDDEVKAEIATTLGITADDPNFDARFQEDLTTTELTEQQYGDMARADVLKTKLTEVFKSEVPDTLPSVHFRQIQVTDQATADDIVTQLNDGADFAALYAEHQQGFTEDDTTGGDGGFVPEGYLDDATEGILFSLEPNEVTTYPTQSAVFVYQLLEKSDTQTVTDDQKNTLSANGYTEWLQEKRDGSDITNELDVSDANIDQDKYFYVLEHAALVTQ